MMNNQINNIELLKKLRDTLPPGEEKTRMSVIIANYMGMEKILTPPTEEEVCEALSVWDNSVKWEYKPLTDENYECITDGKHHYFINDIDCNEVINCLPCPLYLFALT